MKNPEEIVEIKDLSIQCDSFTLGPMSLKLTEGMVFALLGKTGAGKTVFLETLAGFYQHYVGDIDLYGIDARQMAISDRHIGFVYQDASLFPHLNVFGNIAYGLKMRKVKGTIISKKVKEITKRLAIAHLLECYPSTLSGGEKQRVALARALILRPRLLLLDEPFSALDPNTKKQMQEILKELQEQLQFTMIIVTHDFKEAEKLADYIGILLDGKLHEVVSSKRLFSVNKEYSTEVKAFLGIG